MAEIPECAQPDSACAKAIMAGKLPPCKAGTKARKTMSDKGTKVPYIPEADKHTLKDVFRGKIINSDNSFHIDQVDDTVKAFNETIIILLQSLKNVKPLGEEDKLLEAFDGDFGEVAFDHKPTYEEIMAIKLKLVAQADRDYVTDQIKEMMK